MDGILDFYSVSNYSLIFFLPQELAELTESPPEGISVELVDEANLYEWKVYMQGPEGSPYEVSSTNHLPTYLSSTPSNMRSYSSEQDRQTHATTRRQHFTKAMLTPI